MPRRLDIGKCDTCGVMFELIQDCTCDPCTLTCCGKPVTILDAKTADATTEKHVPVIEQTDAGIKVTVGSVPHPMTEEHFIEWIELIAGPKVYRQFLKPGDAPEATFPSVSGEVAAREHCNLHGLWKA